MNFDEETLQEIEDYIEALDEITGLRPHTMFDVKEAIGRQRRKLKILNIDGVVGRSEQLCLACGKEPATLGIGDTKMVCGKCWNKIVS